MRSFETAFPKEFLKDYQKGTMRYTYRDVRCLKNPIDIAIYMKLIWAMKPKTVIEIGTQSGGSALLLADMLQIYGLDATVYTIDLEPPQNIDDPRIVVIEGDVLNLAIPFETHALDQTPHPWCVIEDSAHSFAGCTAALTFFAEHMQRGDLLVMEDGVLDDLGLTDRYDGGPNRAIETYLADNPGVFEVDYALCDMFGRNATYAPNGYLWKL